MKLLMQCTIMVQVLYRLYYLMLGGFARFDSLGLSNPKTAKRVPFFGVSNPLKVNAVPFSACRNKKNAF